MLLFCFICVSGWFLLANIMPMGLFLPVRRFLVVGGVIVWGGIKAP